MLEPLKNIKSTERYFCMDLTDGKYKLKAKISKNKISLFSLTDDELYFHKSTPETINAMSDLMKKVVWIHHDTYGNDV